MKIALGFLLLITFSASPLTDFNTRSFFIVWNVGQGQWTTAITATDCLHFDVGGESFPWKKISALCKDRKNKIFLSHWDWDHLAALSRWPRWDSCLALPPQGKTSSRKKDLIAKLEPCPKAARDLPIWSPSSGKTTNEDCHVVKYGSFLVPGDSPKAQEKIWMKQPWVSSSKVLILGHHGSRTSTSEELLNRLPKVRMAVASARWSRYKHPHAETVAALKRHHISLLRTEDWGNIWFEQ